MEPIYGADLAYIHQAGFSEFARSAAPGVIAILRANGVDAGARVVEAGCGTGVLARELTAAGYSLHGFDPSPAMIELARTTAPDARFEVAAIADAVLPPSDAIVAMGEVLNYGSFSEAGNFIARAAVSLRAGGVLMFDIAESGAYPPHDEWRTGGGDWSVIAIEESDGTRLTRRVMTFRVDDGAVRRGDEVHTLEPYDRTAMTTLLREHGFRLTVRRSYGTRRLPRGHAVYVATKRPQRA